MNKDNKLCIGIDVSKDTLDIYWQNKSYKISNKGEAISAFIKAEIASPANLLCVMETTGGYERIAFETFHQAGISVHLAHPSRVHAFAKACGHFAKTDKLDAILLYKYALFIMNEEDGDVMFDANHQEIIALRRLSRIVEDNLHKAQCRLQQMPALCSDYLKEEIKLYKMQISKIQKEIDEKIDNHPDLSIKREIMVSMKGVGKKIASILLAELPELGTLSRKEVASLVGVAPKTYESGKRSATAHISGGRFYARKALYMVALVSIRHDPIVKQKYTRLLENGKAKKVALVAIMRDAIITLNAMIKNLQFYH